MSDGELATWRGFYDRLEQAVTLLAERIAAGDVLTEPGWTFLAPPAGPLPAELLGRHDRLLAHLLLITDTAAVRLTGLRRELDLLPRHGRPTPGTIAVGRALDIFG